MSLFDLFGRFTWTPVQPPPKPPLYPFVPKYADNPTSARWGIVMPLNPKWYPTEETCKGLLAIFSAAGIVDAKIVPDEMQPSFGLWFPKGSLLRRNDGSTFTASVEFIIPAKWLANHFDADHAPEVDFPDPVFGTLARRECWKVIVSVHDSEMAKVQ